MRGVRVFVLAAVVSLLAAGGSILAAEGGPPEQMRALDFLVGTWTGEGWMQRGPERSTFTSEERVEKRLGGTVLLVEGKHFATTDEARATPVHHALGLFSWNPEAQKYKFQSHLADGRLTDAVAWIEDGKLLWQMGAGPGRTVRYTIAVDDGRWTESGSISMDGEQTWRPFFSMTLTLVR